VKILCEPNDTAISKGRRLSDGTYLDEADFGNVEFSTPSWFHGLLVCNIRTTVVDVCGTNVRAVLLTAHVVAPAGHTTVKTDTESATAAATAPTMTPVTSLTGSVPQSPGVSVWAGSTTATVDDRTSHRFVPTADMTVSKIAITQLSTVTPVTSLTDYISQSPGVTATPTVDGRTDRMLSTFDVTVTEVVVTQVSGVSKGTTAASIWNTWSSWTSCSRSCDTGIQERTRQCLLPSPADCGPGSTDQRFCQTSPCPGRQIDDKHI